MTGQTDFDRGAAILKERYPNIRLLNVTAGADGSHSYYGGRHVFVPSFKLGGTIETTGAGDTFCACVLNFALENGLDGLDDKKLTEMLRFANAAHKNRLRRSAQLKKRFPKRAENRCLGNRFVWSRGYDGSVYPVKREFRGVSPLHGD